MCTVVDTVQSWTQLSFCTKLCPKERGDNSNRDILIQIVNSSRIRFLCHLQHGSSLYRSSVALFLLGPCNYSSVPINPSMFLKDVNSGGASLKMTLSLFHLLTA